ncbi:MAG: peptidylprolyl isomerase [Aestuariibaculum sp.]
MKCKCILVWLCLFFSCYMNAQNANNGVLFRVDSEPVYASEFKRLYNKNIDLVQDESQKDVDEYLNLLIDYKLKIKEAKVLGLDEKPKYKQELLGYKKQLAKNFIAETKVSEALIEEAYSRMANEVKAYHILVVVPENAEPVDTLKAYKTIVKLRERALNEDFEKLREEVHDGKTVYGEDLGWFSAFKMVYKFESEAYNTPVGEISQPFRTRFGYHIVYVQDKRKSRGKRTVAHIMVAHKDNETETEQHIQEVYKKLQYGEAFESLAKQFSNDKSTASKGGILNPISSGDTGSLVFEDEVFDLKNIGDISKPFKTRFGWHIVKLYDKAPIETFETLKPELMQKIERDERSKIIDQALIDTLKKKYKVGATPDLSYFESILNEKYYNRAWQLPVDFPGDKMLFSIKDKHYTYRDFGVFLVDSQQRPFLKKALKDVLLDNYKSYFNKSLIAYQEENLENENEEYAAVLSEFRDGLLLFDFMETHVWSVAKTDTVILKNYYQTHKEKYTVPEKAEVIIATSPSKQIIKRVQGLLEQNLPIDKMEALVKGNNKIEVVFTEDTVGVDNEKLPRNFTFKNGVSSIYKQHGSYNIVLVKRIIPAKQKVFGDVQGYVVSDYQTQKEAELNRKLRQKYPIEINQKILKQLKHQLKTK